MSVGNVGSAVSLQQFIQENPGAEGLAQVLKTKGMADAEIVSFLQTSKEQWKGNFSPDLQPGGEIKIGVLSSGVDDSQMMTDMYSFMQVMLKMAQQMRNVNRELRQSEMQAEQSKLAAAAQEIRNSAEEKFKGAIVAGAMQIGAGALSVAGGAYSMGKMASASSAGSKLQVKDKPVEFKPSEGGRPRSNALTQDDPRMPSKPIGTDAMATAQAKGQAVVTGAQGAGQALQGIGTIVSAVQDKAAAEHDARKAELDADAKVHDQAQQMAGEIMQQMQDIIRDVRDKLSSIEQSRIETTRGISRNI